MPTQNSKKSIGIIFPSISRHFKDSFFDSLVNAFYERHYYVSMCMTNSGIEMERHYIQELSKTSDCLVLMSCAESYEQIKDVIPENIPTIFVFNQPKGCTDTCILESDYQAIYQGIFSIINQGFSKMAFVCSSYNSSYTQSIYKTYCEVLSTATGATDFDRNVFEVNEIQNFNPKKLLDKLTRQGFDSVFCTTSPLTTSMIDTIIVFQPENSSLRMPVIGYSYLDTLLSCRLFANIISPSYDAIINLVVQQALYQISHPDAEKRAYLLKGTLRTNQLT